MKIKSIIVNLLIGAIWLYSMILVYNQNYAEADTAELLNLESTGSVYSDTQQWYDVKIQGMKIGYAMSSFSKTALGWVMKDYSMLRLPMASVIREVLMDFYAVVNDDMSVRAFTFGLSEGDYLTNIYGDVTNGYLKLKIQTGQEIIAQTYPVPDGIYFPGVLPRLLLDKGFPAGKSSLPGFAPITESKNKINIDISTLTQYEFKGNTHDVYRLLITTEGSTSTMWVTENGTLLKDEQPAGMAMELTSKEQALNIPDIDPEWDMLKMLAVPIDKEIERPREAAYMKVKMTGIDPTGFNLVDNFQRIISTDPLIIEISPRGFVEDAVKEETEIKLAEYLAAEPFIQSDNADIKRQVKLIIGEADDIRQKIDLLSDWVYANIKKDFAISLPSATEILRVRRGDCNEHTTLYTALARAAGIPTKVCLGIVYNDGLFYYHAWPAVYLDNGWVPIDPTFGQNTADATHIKILGGNFDSQALLMQVIGKLKLELLDISTSEGVALKID